MRLFWKTVIEPMVEILQPGVIVEIGSSAGGNTSNILEYCRRSGAKLHIVNPFYDTLRPATCLGGCPRQ